MPPLPRAPRPPHGHAPPPCTALPPYARTPNPNPSCASPLCLRGSPHAVAAGPLPGSPPLPLPAPISPLFSLLLALTCGRAPTAGRGGCRSGASGMDPASPSRIRGPGRRPGDQAASAAWERELAAAALVRPSSGAAGCDWRPCPCAVYSVVFTTGGLDGSSSNGSAVSSDLQRATAPTS
uniref:Uncharacterized protein n=1 Tax=Leersia perrieri TaxID=77586 RepID=A0A0D9XY97_9ORYZ